MSSITALAGTYKIEEFLGEGLNSCVYRAFKENGGLGVRLDVALKILKSETMVSLWRNEFMRLSQISSEFCVKLLGWELLQTGPALVLEYVNGLNLYELDKFTRLSRADLDEIARQARRGLEDLSENGLFHGDLNPHNIMIDIMGRVKLVDFGISVDRKNSLVTPKYASAAVMLGQQPNLATDLESLDLVLTDIGRKLKIHDCDNNCHSLVYKVAKALKERRKVQGATQPFMVPAIAETRAKKVRRYARNAVIPLLFLTSILSRGDVVTPRVLESKVAQLRVVSDQWLSLSLERKSLGFAPVDQAIVAGKRLRLEWRNATGSGEIFVVAKPGEIVKFGEKNFAR